MWIKTNGRFKPCFWLPSMDVTSTVNGPSVELDLGFDDIRDTFDVYALSACGEYVVEAERERR